MDVLTPAQRRANMKAIKGKDTKPEMAVRRLVHKMGFRYVLHDRRRPGRPDLVFPARHKIIFVHGCYWHMHDCRQGSVVPATNAEFWQTKRRANVARDNVVLAKLAADRWSVLVVWECETKDSERLRSRLLDFLA